MKSNETLPPKWADKLLSWFCKAEVLENVQGDLHEMYQQRVEILGKRKANLLFIRDVFGLLRPRLIRKLEGTRRLNHYGIFKNYFKTSIRNIKHNALFSGVNVIGLAISMSVGILMIVLLSELHSFDVFHAKKDRIYRVTTSRQALMHGESNFFASAPHYIADQIDGQVAGVEQILVLDRELVADLKTGTNGIAITGYYATGSFFDVLSFELAKGDPGTALEKPGSIVLTESTAKKLFGDADPLNKIITVESNQDFKTGVITGVVEDPPINSHLDFEALVSMTTVENSLTARRRNFKNNPGNYAQSYVYVVLTEGADIAGIESTMANIMADYNSKKAPNELSLQPMEEFVTKDAGFQPGPVFSERKLDMMLGLTIIVILSACFNYANLSLVRALRRSKEISVRKISGASRLEVFLQFMTEALLLSLIALVIAIGIFFLIKPGFLGLRELTPGGRAMFLLDITTSQLFYFLLFAIVVGCMAGFFPALVLSKLKASALFNDASKVKLFPGFSMRQVLITGQVALSIGLIMCAVMVHKQYKYVLNYDLGYDTENIINVNVKGDYMDLLENEFARVPGVVATSRSSVTLGTRDGMMADAMTEDRSDTVMFNCNHVDSNYLNMHGFELLAGTGVLTSVEGEMPNSIIVNEGFIKELRLGSPEEAIGKHIWYFEAVELEIQGVVKDFVSSSLDAETPKAFGFMNGGVEFIDMLEVKIAGDDLLTTMQSLEKTYKQIDPVHPFEASFYDDQIEKTYESSRTTYTIISFLAFLAISISTLGLLGMAVFTMETRMKEISIRKVLGAGIRNLTVMLSRSFLTMIVVAAVIAVPVTIYIVDKLLLRDFLYRTDIGFWEIVSGLVIVLFIGVLSVGWQVRTAAIQNPADLLRDE